MGITPISNLIPLPPVRSLEGKLEPMPMERVENASKSGDETYSPSGGGTARGSEGDAAEEGEEFEPEIEPAAVRPVAGSEQWGAISFFA